LPKELEERKTMTKKAALPAEIKKVIRSALAPSLSALRRLARYKLEPALARRMQALGERKEFLGKEQHEELVALVTFAQRRSIEKLEAQVALQRLNEILPEVAARK
jgi:hypothetical protein